VDVNPTSGIRVLSWFVPTVVAGVMALPAGLAAQGRGLKSEELHRLRSVGEVRISPDGGKVLYTVESREGKGHSEPSLWLHDVASGKAAPFLGEGTRASRPRWSPDGKWVAYIGREGERDGIFVVRADGSGSRFLAEVQDTNHPLPSTGDRIAWSPDSGSVAFVSALAGPEEEEATGDPVVIRRYLYKPTASEGLTRFNDNRRLHIFVADLASGNVRQLTEGTRYHHSIDWSPSGEEILFVSNWEPDPDFFFNYDVFAVNVADKTIRRLTTTENVEYNPHWSPDGKTIVYESTRRGLTSSETTMEDTHIWLMDSEGGNRRELGAVLDNRQEGAGFTPDGNAVLFTVQERGSVNLYRLPAAGGQPEVVAKGLAGVETPWSIGKGNQIAYAASSPTDMPQLYLKGPGADPRALTDLNRDVLGTKEIAKVEAFTFLSFDGKEVEAFLTHPLGRTARSKHPLIAVIKGGPHGQDGPSFDYRTQVYANHGWASIKVNYRGSTGYGQAFADAIFGDQDGGEAKDVIYAVEAAARRYEWIDSERLGIQGGSYGGQLSMWIVTQTNRFKAAIPMYGICNLLSFNYMAYYHDYLAVEFGAFPHQDNLMDLLWERSALKHVANVKTPVMLVHGENDNDVPIAESEQFYIALKDVGVDTIMVRYPREGHGIREIGHQIDLVERSIDWYEQHFAPVATTTSSRD
jgi:dipeptidyl aminopeptidase/acylaminoacyl peptidase